MMSVGDTYGAVYAGGSVVTLARLETADGDLIVPSDIISANYSIVEKSSCSVAGDAVVDGHTEVAIDPASILFETLQTGVIWDQDTTGYNFRHEIDVATAAAFPVADKTYRISYRLMPVSGQPVILQFSIRTV